MLALARPWVCFAATTQTWEISGYQDFSRGRINGLSLASDGKLLPGTAHDDAVRFGPSRDLERGAGSGWVAVRRHRQSRPAVPRGCLGGQSALVWTADRARNLRRSRGSQGRRLRGNVAGRQGVSHRERQSDRIFAPGAHYIWALAVAPDGALMVATGDEGKIFRVTRPGQGSVLL